jgi:exopolysaccharide/PEP-CTERM locus tyrosine autokinase
MSLIERALERLKRESAARTEVPLPPASPLTTTRGASGDSEGGADPAAKLAIAAPSLPSRGDRVVRVDTATLRAAGLLAPTSEERRLAEEYRIIKRPLLKAMVRDETGELKNLIAVTSSLPGEGKTFTCVNLALSLSMERGREVILVDGDASKQHLTRIFGLGGEPGLLDAGGEEGTDLEHTLLRTDLPSLFILPVGRRNSEATEVLRSERTRAILSLLASDPRRIVLIDCAPLLVTSDSGVLASVAGQVVIVVKASETPQEVVSSAIEAVTEEKPVSLILNQVLSAPEHHYGYYYGGYGYDRPAYGSDSAVGSSQDDSR